MIGSPTENLDDIKATINLSKELFPDYVHFSVTTPFPATELYFKGLQDNIIKKDYWKEFSRNPQPGFKPPAWEENFTRDELFKILIKAYKSYYFTLKYILRRLKKLRSFNEVKNNFKAGWKLLSLTFKNA